MANSLGRRLASRFRRVVLYRLIMPVLRAKYPPEYTARSVLFGMLVAMTPTVGVQMPIVFLCWLAIRFARPQWDFNVVIAMLWTWVTNVFTLAPIYYVFLVTGRIMLGSPGDLTGYSAFATHLQDALATDAGIIESLWVYTISLFEIWGVPMFVGSIPWAILCSWLGYRWSLRLINRFRNRRKKRAEQRRRLSENN
ncbi:MAG: DUF2062 domain-containing protein [Alphaproteobacteria bacterium]|nr:DUF2062 domain-containing protein [Alphaproteobacteria bacterium]